MTLPRTQTAYECNRALSQHSNNQLSRQDPLASHKREGRVFHSYFTEMMHTRFKGIESSELSRLDTLLIIT